MDEIVTSDLAKFGYRELEIASRLLSAYVKEPDILGNGVQVFMNMHSGYVFLSDEDYNTAMMNGDKLEIYYCCSECGDEGFLEDLAGNHHLDEYGTLIHGDNDN